MQNPLDFNFDVDDVGIIFLNDENGRRTQSAIIDVVYEGITEVPLTHAAIIVRFCCTVILTIGVFYHVIGVWGIS